MVARLWCAVLILGLVRAATGAPVRFSDEDPIVLNDGEASAWQITNRFSTSNGLPTGGNGTSSGSGLAILDVSSSADPVRGDAFDGGNLVFVDNVQFVAPDTVDVSDGALTAGPVTLSELNVTVEYRAIADSPFLRTLVTLENPTATARQPIIELVTNVGSDAATQVDTSIGFPLQTQILVTSDGDVPTDLVNVFALRGGFSGFVFPLITPLVDMTVFNVAGTQGVRARYEASILPGETIRVMVMNGVASEHTGALAEATFLAGNPPVGGSLMAGLTADDALRIVNWNYYGALELAGGGARWVFDDRTGTSNGDAAGGECRRTRAFGLDFAAVDGSARGDAVESGLALFVGGVRVRSPLVTKSATSLLTDPQTLGGLSVSLEHTALPDSPTLRTRVLLTNPGTTEVATTVQMATNFGSDEKTTVRVASDGRTAIDDFLRWVVTSDQRIDEPTGDLVNTSVLQGPGQPSVGVRASSQVFECSSPDGLLASYDVRIPAGGTQALLLFNELHDTIAAATADASRFDAISDLGDPLIANLDESALLQVVNWDFCRELPASFPTVRCSLDALEAGTQRALMPGKLLSKLVVALGATRAAVNKADTLRGKGKRGPARKQLAKAAATLKSLARRLGSKAYTAVLDPDAREALVERTNALTIRIGTVRSAL